MGEKPSSATNPEPENIWDSGVPVSRESNVPDVRPSTTPPVAMRPVTILSSRVSSPGPISTKPPITDEIDSEWGEEGPTAAGSSGQVAAIAQELALSGQGAATAEEPVASLASPSSAPTSPPPPSVLPPLPAAKSYPLASRSSPVAAKSSPVAAKSSPVAAKSSPVAQKPSPSAPASVEVPLSAEKPLNAEKSEPNAAKEPGPDYMSTQKSLISPTFPADPALPKGLRAESITIREPASRSSAPPPPSSRGSAPASSPHSSPLVQSPTTYSSDPAPTIKSETAPPVAELREGRAPAPAVEVRSRRVSSSSTIADSPQGFAAARAREVTSSSKAEANEPPQSGSLAKWALLSLAVAAAVAFVATRRGSHEAAHTAPEPTAVTSAPAAPPVLVEAPPASAVVADAPATASAAPAPSEAAPAASAAEALPTASAVAEAAPAAPSAAAAAPSEPTPAPTPAESAAPHMGAPLAPNGKFSVIVDARPTNARIFFHGKEVGKIPVTIEVEPGTRRAFEVGAPGYQTRRLVVDGSKASILIGLRPLPSE